MHNRHPTLRPARIDEAGIISTMWHEAAVWLGSRGIDQWQYPANVDRISRDIARGTAHVALDGSVTYLGTIALDGFANLSSGCRPMPLTTRCMCAG
ncbi:hypothetical protein ACIQU6_05440 [Streptomyces sp. NPDC090442]|uniref:hypothetical protein n=1 Tax=Streptomyces sp. NPDC090442 TaxID=3365962 RepID=UPI00382A14C5